MGFTNPISSVTAVTGSEPRFRGHAGVAQSVTSAVWTVLGGLAADEDPQNGLTGGTTWVASTSGLYLVTSVVPFADAAVGIRAVKYLVGGADQNGNPQLAQDGVAGQVISIQHTRLLRVTAGNGIQVAAYQNSGGPLNVGGAPPGCTVLEIVLVSA